MNFNQNLIYTQNFLKFTPLKYVILMIKLIFIKNNLIFFICVKYYFNALYYNLYKVCNGLIYRGCKFTWVLGVYCFIVKNFVYHLLIFYNYSKLYFVIYFFLFDLCYFYLILIFNLQKTIWWYTVCWLFLISAVFDKRSNEYDTFKCVTKW